MESSFGSAVYVGELMHHRFRPKAHRFSYRVASWLLDLDELDELDHRLTLFSHNRFNVVSFFDRDHGEGSDTPLQEQINRLLRHHNIATADKITLLCYPRLFGYTFNPLAVYFCYLEQQLIAIVYEVSNTFGERHSYVAAVELENRSEESRAIEHKKTAIRQQADKALHVSPFFPMDCYYCFRIRPPAASITLGIQLNDADGKLFTAVFNGLRQTISDRFIVKQTTLLPLQTLKVIAAIHWEALRLWLKGIAIFSHRPRPFFFSHSRAQMPMAEEKPFTPGTLKKNGASGCFSPVSSANKENKK